MDHEVCWRCLEAGGAGGGGTMGGVPRLWKTVISSSVQGLILEVMEDSAMSLYETNRQVTPAWMTDVDILCELALQ